MKKRSNLILALIFFSACIGFGLYAYHIRNSIEEKVKSNTVLEVVEGEEFIREIDLSYKHLHVEYPAVSIEGRYQNHIELSGIATASDMVHYEVRQDTLYIRYFEHSTRYVKPYPDRLSELINNRPLAVRVHVGGVGLKSITMGQKGLINIPATNENKRRSGKKIYTDEDIERYTLNFDTLDIVNGHVSMLIEGEVLNIHNTNKSRSRFDLQGDVDRFNVEYHVDSEIFLNRYDFRLNCNVASINANKNEEGIVAGALQLAVQDTLIANLYGAMDVYYHGDPVVKKYERSTGRVVHMYESEE